MSGCVKQHDPRTDPWNPAWYGPKPIPLDPAMHHLLRWNALSEPERQRLLNEDMKRREAAETARLEAASREEASRLKRERKTK